jgi:hypothetical protein
MAAAKQEIAGQPNQGRSPNSEASHFDRAHVRLGPAAPLRIFIPLTIIILSLCAEGR